MPVFRLLNGTFYATDGSTLVDGNGLSYPLTTIVSREAQLGPQHAPRCQRRRTCSVSDPVTSSTVYCPPVISSCSSALMPE